MRRPTGPAEHACISFSMHAFRYIPYAERAANGTFAERRGPPRVLASYANACTLYNVCIIACENQWLSGAAGEISYSVT